MQKPAKPNASHGCAKTNVAIFCACLLWLAHGPSFTPTANASEAQLEDLKQPLFIDANAALKKANKAQANILAPTSYSAAGELFKKAERIFSDGGSIETITQSLTESTTLFMRAQESATKARSTFTIAWQARQDAENAEAAKYAPESWQQAELQFANAAIGLEKNREKTAQRNAKKAEEGFRQAELESIKANYLSETRNLLVSAERLRADRFAPGSYTQASTLMEEAEKQLNLNRYDTDRPRNLASQAKHQAMHAIYIAKLNAKMRDDDLSLEDILLDWETSISKLAQQVDVPVYFDNGQQIAIDQIGSAVKRTQSNLQQRNHELNDRELEISALRSQINELQTKLGGESQTIQTLNKQLAKQALLRKRFTEVELMFEEGEAMVLRQANNIILRMIGLNFDSASAQLKPQHDPLLIKLQTALATFPESEIVIEGHTDAYGSDQENLELSQRRADSLLQYLLANTPFSPAKLTALGYGESHPVANNETAEGRTRNRRIDIVVYPNL